MKTVKIKSLNDSLYLSFPYDKTIISYIKTFPDREWNENLKMWILPFFDDYLETFNKNRFGIIFINEDEGLLNIRPYLIFIKTMKNKRMSSKNIRSHAKKIEKFIFENPNFENLFKEAIENYIANLNETLSYKNQLINGLNLFYLYAYGKKIGISNIEKS